MGEYKLTYFPFPGRAELARLLFHIGGISFEDERIPFEEFGRRKAAGEVRFNALPELHVNGVKYTQSIPIARYVVKQVGLYPSDDLAQLRVDELLDAFHDLVYRMGPSFKEQDPEKKKAMREELAAKDIPTLLRGLEEILALNTTGSCYAVGENITVADLYIMQSIDAIKSGNLDHIPTTIAGSYSHLMTVHEKAHAHPKVREYYAARS
eukprot:EC798978.1.p1 GENE.EC798978.1~~EC798978.1.p1  ORF type:complete len:209 (+),score=89.51 EC798978.1:60-686(+)